MKKNNTPEKKGLSNAFSLNMDRDGYDDQHKQPSEIEGDKGCCSMFAFLCKTSYTDVGRNKFHFCLAFAAVFTVVLSTLIVKTITTKGPIVFL